MFPVDVPDASTPGGMPPAPAADVGLQHTELTNPADSDAAAGRSVEVTAAVGAVATTADARGVDHDVW